MKLQTAKKTETGMQYNQFCPIAKAVEILGERWTILILREVLLGGRTFNVLQRGLGDISPALLTARLKALETKGLVVRRRIPRQKGHEYFPTPACEALLPVLREIGQWGVTWARHTILDTDFDVDLLMLNLERSVDPSKLVDSETVIKFRFSDLSEHKDWWLIVERNKTEVCLSDPGRDVNVYFNCTVRAMADVWMGHRTYLEAMKAGDLSVQGDLSLTRTIKFWLRPSMFADAKVGNPAD
jgi:DNA-binding HxlR family transcriptional regulator